MRAPKKMPPFKTLLAKPRKTTPQSWEQQAQIAKMWTAFMGGQIKTKH